MNKKVREIIYQKYDGHCAYCGQEIAMKEMQVDHRTPKTRMGVNDVENYEPSCRQCNYYKSNFLLEQFRKNMKTLHERIGKCAFIVRLGIKYGIVEIKPFDGKFYFEKMNQNQ
ncbi:MAG: HNH endonuclease [Anaerolineaceae bacterium]|nr:HNH endonuclease [Anaerolineaceae bacterium]